MQEILENLWNTITGNEVYMVLAIFAVAIWLCSVVTTIYRFFDEDYHNAHHFVERAFKSFFASIALYAGLAFLLSYVYGLIIR